jgi:putative hemolysin
MLNENARLIDLGNRIEGSVKRTLFRLVEQPIERLLSVSTINELYAHARTRTGHHPNYFANALDVLNVEYDLSDEDRAKIPATGPVMVVANHPFGGLDGIILGDILARRRQDIRLLGNHLLAGVSEIQEWLINVDPFRSSDAVWSNIGPVKSALRWLRQGGAVGIFPSGTVSHLKIGKGISDPTWHPNVASMARRCQATVVPVFFEGRNSMAFQLAGLLHPGLRTALLPHELLKRRSSKVLVRIGRPLAPDKLERFADDATLIDYLRFKTYMLKRRDSPVRPRFKPRPAAIAAPVALVEAVPPGVLESEINRLPPDTRLSAAGPMQVFIAEARQIPAVLRELGRLRERTFRDVAEGTGKAIDLDRYDDHYLHLFMWNKEAREIVGSYRVGRANEILAERGVAGLYTNSLFKFDGGFLERLGPALELGRSFVRAEYQRKATSLALLWRGIGEYLVRNPHFKVLFGPVSISQAYHRTSQGLMIEFLGKQRGDEELSGLVKAKNPPRDRLGPEERVALGLAKDVDDISRLVEEIEEDNKGMPVLLKHYLRLNARLLSFNVDPTFGHCVDGLIVVDLRNADTRMLRRFMGDEGHAFFASVA